MEEKAKKLYDERVQLMSDAIAMKETSRIPVAPFLASVVQRLESSSYKDLYYDFDRAGQAAVNFYTKYPVDACTGCRFTSGKAQEIGGINIIDWPGEPGTKISDYSSHQVHEIEYLTPEECYENLIKDFDGFYLRHYIPRVYDGLKGLETLNFNPATVLSTTGGLGPMLKPEFLETIDKIKQIAEYDSQAAAKSAEWSAKIEALGIPKLFTGGGEVPFDIISDYFRTTLPAMTDLFEYETEIIELCNMLADRMIASWKYFEGSSMPVKRVFFPLHKAMDGFMSPEQFEKIYMGPYLKMLDYLISIGVTPFVFTEGPYNTRLDQMAEMLPKGCLVAFETVDMKRAKKTVGKNNCITGNLSLYTLEFGTKQQTIDQTKELIDICAPGGGYIFGASGCVENAKRENLEAMFETLETYGHK